MKFLASKGEIINGNRRIVGCPVDAVPIKIPGLDYKYLVLHHEIKPDGTTYDFAWSISEYQTGRRVMLPGQHAYSEEQAVEMCLKAISKLDSKLNSEAIAKRIKSDGALNKIDPADWPD